MRDSFIFYRSFYEAISDLSNEQQLEIYQAIADFSLNFKEPNLSGVSKTIFTLIKPQLEANNKRFMNGTKPKQKQEESKTEAKQKQEESKTEAKQKQEESKTEANNNVNVNNNVNNNNNGSNSDKSEFTFTLSQLKLLSSTTREYQSKLKDYIDSKNGMSYQDFYNSCEMKGYKYKNFKLAYDKWNKDNKPINKPITSNGFKIKA